MIKNRTGDSFSKSSWIQKTIKKLQLARAQGAPENAERMKPGAYRKTRNNIHSRGLNGYEPFHEQSVIEGLKIIALTVSRARV
jgi:hypothetical protein